MQRKLFCLGLALALVPSISFPGRADLLKNLKTDGSIETRSFGIDNETDRDATATDYRSETHTRVMVGANFDLLDDVHSRVLLSKNNRVYGAAAENAQTVQSNIVLDNAYVKIDKVFGAVDLTMGRQFYGDPMDLNIYFGPQNDDILSITSVDLFRADASIADGWARITGIAGKTADTNVVPPAYPANTDTTLYGGEVASDKKIPIVGSAAAYYYTAQTHSTKVAPATGNNTVSVTGARLMGDIIAGLGYHAEYIQDFGRNNSGTGPTGNPNPSYNGSAYFLGVNYGRELDGRPIRAHAEWGRGSDDFVSIAPGRRFGIIWGEHTNFGPETLTPTSGGAFTATANGNTGLSNLRVLDAGLGISPISKLGIDLNWYRFMYDANRGNVGVSAGTEYDLIVSWKHSENVSFEVNAATFQVGTSLQNPTALAPGNTATAPITRLGADVKIKF